MRAESTVLEVGDPGLELRELRTFFSVFDELNFGRAAHRLGVTPSRVSQTIQLLELRVGGPLFRRSSRRVEPTPLGRLLHERAAPAYRELELALAEVRATAVGPSGALRLGMYAPVIGGPRLVQIIKLFESQHPGCEVIVVDTGFERDQLDWLRSGDLDILAMRLPLDSSDVTVGPTLSCAPRAVAVAVDHPLADRPGISVEDLADYAVCDLPTLSREMMDVFLPRATPSGRPIRRIEVRTIAESLARVARGEAVHLTVDAFADHVRHPGIVTVPVSDLPASKTALVWLRAHTSPAVQAFATAAKQVQLVGSNDSAVSKEPTTHGLAR